MRCVRSLSQKRGSTAKFAGQDEFNVFDLKAPNSVRIKAFKNAIYQSAMGKIKVNFSPMEVNLITKLVCGLKAGEKKNVKKSLHTKVLFLNKSLLTQRLTDKDILEEMNLAASPINVTIPRDITSQEEKKKNELQLRKAGNMDLHPSKKMHIEELLQSLNLDMNDHEEVYKKLSFYLQNNGDNRTSEDSLKPKNVNIDVKSLKWYLQNIEKKAHRKNVVNEKKKSQTRTYQWKTESFPETVSLTAGNIIFKRKPSLLWKRLQNGLSGFLNINKMEEKAGHSSKVLQGKSILLHSLVNNKGVTLSNNFDYGVFNINFTDLFGVINASGYPPDRALNDINDIESKGWKCVGNLYDNNKIIVFQRNHSFLKKKKIPKRSFIDPKVSLISFTALLASFLAYYKYRLSQSEEAER
ncbi:hypothetical protein SMKI_06G2800 [Saccharomyces mikatae IFO 1815]|uniref:YPL168W-like protein n=1 Tax=Saccharomyces mikatae IFO 1815 TaxID=226126 RepID=A0AA35NHF3_SACMI|nr:uncharacterized protein SMKI_06G2800 [Saccharomyces mikatae IFO 1815]CAI4038928.1 hypothetical protein SMKI_06G2800 [Saccharomyces mikatae IFO 1815]